MLALGRAPAHAGLRMSASVSALWLDLQPVDRAEWLGKFELCEQPKGYELVREYHKRTEAFDRLLPHVRVEGNSAMPVGAWARAQSSRYASKLRQHLQIECTSEEWIAANKVYLASGDLDRDMNDLPWPTLVPPVVTAR